MTPKVQAMKAKIDEGKDINLKNYFTTNETINIVKRQLTQWEKIFANYISDKG